MPPDSVLVARLLDLVARYLHARNACGELGAGQWAVVRYLEVAGPTARTAPHISTFLGWSLDETRLAMLSLKRKQLVEIYDQAQGEPVFQLTELTGTLKERDPVVRGAQAISRLSQSDREELARLLETVAEHLAR